MKCPKCGTELPKGASQCSNCGQKFVTGKYCPHCRAVIPSTATVCPQCKQPVGGSAALQGGRPQKQSSFRWWRIPIYILVLLIGFGAGSVFTRQSILSNVNSAFSQFTTSSDGSTSSKQAATSAASNVDSATVSSDQSSENSKADKKYYFADNVLIAEDVKIEITDWRVIPVGETGNEYGDVPVIAFWYSTTNLSGKELDPSSAWIAMFTAVQDNNPDMINELQVASLPDAAFRDTQSATIKKGGTVDCAWAYELDDTTTPVVLKGRKGIFGEELGEQTFNIAG